jgi:hypothetical protein
MKLRMRHNSVRLRLTRGEVDQLVEAGIVEETVEFRPQPLVYILHASEDCRQMEARFNDGWMTISVPDAQAKKWAGTEQVGMQATHAGVAILVEKDWECRHAESEENEDAFPHPEG